MVAGNIMSKQHQGITRRLFDSGYLSRFLSVGVIGAIFDNVVLVFAVELVAIAPLPAKVLSAELSIVLMFVINEQWTFAGQGCDGYRKLLRRLITSNIVRVGGLVIGMGILYLLHTQLGVWYLLANIFGIGVGFIANSFFESIYTWRI